MGSLHYASSLAYMTLQFACAAAGGTFTGIAANSATHISPLDKTIDFYANGIRYVKICGI
jgi:hypothetical protein